MKNSKTPFLKGILKATKRKISKSKTKIPEPSEALDAQNPWFAAAKHTAAPEPLVSCMSGRPNKTLMDSPMKWKITQKGSAAAAVEAKARRRDTCAARGSGLMLTPSKNLLRAAQLQRVWGVVLLGQSCELRQLANHAWEGPFAKCRRAP